MATLIERAHNARYRLAQRWLRVRGPKKTRGELHNYWRHPAPAHAPEHQIAVAGRSEWFADYLRERGATPTDRVFELGPGVGRNLHALWQQGFRDLAGVEISEQAVDLMRRTFPDMTAGIRIGAAEDVLPTIADQAFEVVFTTGVLMAIHPDSADLVLDELARICARTLVVVENETHASELVFPRNYRHAFQYRGLEQVDEITDVGTLGIEGYTVRAFRKPTLGHQMPAPSAIT